MMDLSPPESSGDDPDVALAAAHVERCPMCQQQVFITRRFDGLIRQSLHQVDVPVDLLDQLLQRVQEPAAKVDSGTSKMLSRRQSRWTALAVAACLFIAVGAAVWWSLPIQQPAPLSFDLVLEQLEPVFGSREQALSSMRSLPGWDQPSPPPLPSDALARGLHGTNPRLVDLDGRPGAEGVAYEFSTNGMKGVFVVLPRLRVDLAPMMQFSSLQVVAWPSTLGDESYVCFIHEGRADQLLQQLRAA